jgi:serine/threonine protein kinase
MFSQKKYNADKSYLAKSDVFATGLVLYEMLTKKLGMKSIMIFAKKMEGPELDLEFPQYKMKWKPLIEQMVMRNYRNRITAQQALDEFVRIRDEPLLGGKLKQNKHSKKNKRNKTKKQKTKNKKTKSKRKRMEKYSQIR